MTCSKSSELLAEFMSWTCPKPLNLCCFTHCPGGQTTAHGAAEGLYALYDYTASPTDVLMSLSRPIKLNMQRGDVFHLKYKRSEGGWCLVSTASDVRVEGWVGTMISSFVSFVEYFNFLW